MIRLAGYQDTKVIVDLLQQFLKETSYQQAEQAASDGEHLSKLVWLAIQFGHIWIAEKDGLAVGLLMAVKEKNMWMPKQIQMREICWYVLPEYRSTSLGGKLFISYQKEAETQLKQGLINGYFTTKMTTTDHIDLDRRGFRLTEQTYLKD